MSAENKTRYEIQKILIDCIKNGLTAYIGQNHGFDVMEFAQASFQKADRIVLLNLIRAGKRGWLITTNPVESLQLKRKDEWIEEQTWQIHFLLKKKKKPSISDLQADDVATMIKIWLNAGGADELRTNGCAPLVLNDTSVMVYNDDSELYQKRAVLTLKLQVPKSLSTNEVDIDYTVPKIYPI